MEPSRLSWLNQQASSASDRPTVGATCVDKSQIEPGGIKNRNVRCTKVLGSCKDKTLGHPCLSLPDLVLRFSLLLRGQRLAVNDLVGARFVEVTDSRFLVVTALAVERPRTLEFLHP